MEEPLAVQTLIFMDFEVAGKYLKTEFGGDLQPRNQAGLNSTDYLARLAASDEADLSRVPHIAEMSFVFVPRSLFIEGCENMHHKLRNLEKEGHERPVIRIELAANVFTSQLNPELDSEDWAIYESKKASVRLRRTELSSKNTFAQEWPALHHLLSVSPKPACLIAHNGCAFDFRILMHELTRTGMAQRYPIPDEVYFLDSYLTYMDIEKMHHQRIRQTLDTIDWSAIVPPPQPHPVEQAVNEEQSATEPVDEIVGNDKSGQKNEESDDDGIECLAADCPLAHNMPTSSSNSSVIATDNEEEGEEKQPRGTEENGQQKETNNAQHPEGEATKKEEEEEEEITFIEQRKSDGATPANGRKRTASGRSIGLMNGGLNGIRQQMGSGAGRQMLRTRKWHPWEGLDRLHPFRYLRMAEWCPAKRRRIPAHIFEKDADGQWHFSEHASERLLTGGGRFKLEYMFKALIGADFRPHRAQADAEALLQVSMAYGDPFLEYMNAKRAPFPSATPSVICSAD